MSNVYLPELAAIQTIADAINGLTPAERMRVAAWLYEYAQQGNADYADGNAPEARSAAAVLDADFEAFADDSAQGALSDDESDAEATPKTYDTFDELYAAVAPKRGAQKAAAAAWWLESHDGQQSWTAFEVNKLLKSIDVKVSSISIVLSNAVKAKDPMVEQLGRGGDSTRSRKAFCLTETGKAYVEAQLA